MIELYSNDKLLERVRALKPHLIICPFLIRPIPSQIYDEFITLIVHPGPVGDRGAYNLLTSITMKAMKRMLCQILTGTNPAVERVGKYSC